MYWPVLIPLVVSRITQSSEEILMEIAGNVDNSVLVMFQITIQIQEFPGSRRNKIHQQI